MHLIETINISNIFTLDTESVCTYKQANRPALIQFQVIRPNLKSYVILIEMCHLPRSTTNTFKLIQHLFKLLFNPNKKIYVWESIDELEKFITFNLFPSDQIYFRENINLQNEFKLHWQICHPHTLPSSINGYFTCICEACIGIQPKNPWGLQDSAAYELNRWLDKRQTRSPFDIDLDLKLKHLNSKAIEYRQLLIKYTADDCLSMEQILINMNLIMEQRTPSIEIPENKNILCISHDYSSMTHPPEFISLPPSTLTRIKQQDWESISSNDDESTTAHLTPQQSTPALPYNN